MVVIPLDDAKKILEILEEYDDPELDLIKDTLIDEINYSEQEEVYAEEYDYIIEELKSIYEAHKAQANKNQLPALEMLFHDIIEFLNDVLI
jgi:hypothetical protein